MLMVMRGYARFVLIGLLILGLFCGGAMGAAPTLSGGSVSPSTGDTTTTFVFSVTFTDADNDTADYVNVTLDGTNHSLSEDDPSDQNTTDGKLYKSTTIGPLSAATHYFNFTAANGTDVVGPTLDDSFVVTAANSLPTLSGGSVSPSTGDTTTTFVFSVTFTDADNDTADYVNVTLDGTNHSLSEDDPSDQNTIDGKLYKSTTIGPLSAATHYFNFTAANGTDVVGPTLDDSFVVDVSNHEPELLSESVSYDPDSTVSSTFYFNVTYKDVDHNASTYMNVKIDGTDHAMFKVDIGDTNPTDGIDYTYNTTELTVGDHSYYFLTSDGTYPVNTTPATVTVHSKTYYTGDRIWNALVSPSREYTWTAESFSGFYYDLDSGFSSETMTIKLDDYSDRSIGSGDLEYTTTPINTKFEYADWGSYQIIGFMAENYFAGYKAADTTLTDTDVSLISSGQMSKVLMNEEKSRSVYAGSALILEEGYTLNIVELDKDGNKVYVILTKDGSELESTILSSGKNYIYKKDLGSADDVPIIAVYFDEMFQGHETSAVFVKGIFQISDEYITIKSGDNYGKMEVDTFSAEKIEMSNDNSFSLSKGNTIDIMGKIKFLVADNDDLRFAPFVDMTEPGTYELRGTVTEDTEFEWTPLNFEGFYYSIDEGIATESLKVTSSGTTIDDDDLVYTATPADVAFEYTDSIEWTTKYKVIGFMAEKYFAGYPSGTFGTDGVSMISNGQLSKVLINEDKSRAIHSGSGLILDEGYVLNIIEVDKNGDKVAVSLSKDGSEIGDMSIVTAGNTYVYEKDLGSSDDVPIIAVHFDEIFQGRETSAIFVDGIFQISDQYITVEDGDTYGKMKVTSTSGEIVMKNDDSISLTRGKSIPIMGDILFKVADDDDDDVRYYPYIEVTTAPLDSLDISMPTSVKQGDYISIIVTSRGATVSDAAVKFDDDNIGKTSNEGTISYKPALSGTYTVTAEKEGYVSASGQIEVISPLDETKKMSIEVSPDVVYEGNQITISTIKSIGGEAIEGVDVTYDGKSLGTTSSDGTLSYTVKEPGMHKLTATKTGYLDAELNLEVLALEAKFEFSNLVVSPLEVKMGRDVTITLDASNTGKAEGEYNVDLLINGNLTESKTVTLAVDESTTIEFTVTKDEPGTYLVEVNGLSGTFEVLEKTGSVALYVLGILGVFAAVAVGYMFTAGGWTVEMVSTKVAEFIESIR